MRWKTNWRGEGELKRKKVESERGDAGDDDKATTSSPDWDWSTWCFHERYGVTSTWEAKQNNHCHGIGMFLRWTPQQLFSPWENTSRRRFSFRFWLWIIHEEGEKKKWQKPRNYKVKDKDWLSATQEEFLYSSEGDNKDVSCIQETTWFEDTWEVCA